MSKITENYIRKDNPDAVIKNPSFTYCDMGNLYSYVRLNAIVDGKNYSKDLKMSEFFEWLFIQK